ncbi:MAG: response regulator transcription factor [Solirubrobacterales bacterium]|nr:response regulator transcription factor [Solirubrobacterales bacterium]MBV9839535.1 response regulator transcription factor [Solirubrobacterales bacterium]
MARADRDRTIDRRAQGGSRRGENGHDPEQSLERRALPRREHDRLRLIVSDPDPLARRVVRDSLTLGEGFVVVAEAKDGVEAVELATHYRPELLLTEVGLPRQDGIAACRQIVERAPEVRVVMFSVPQPRQLEVAAMLAGASGFLSKNSSIESTVQALRSVAGGDAAISRSFTMHLIELLRQMPVDGAGMRPVKSNLTSREWEVLDLLCSGASTRDIAQLLVLTEDTVYSHAKSILRKLGVRSRREAVAEAARLRKAGLT